MKKTFVITGASRGIGKFLMDSYLSEGENVIGLYNSTQPDVNREHCFKVDVSNASEVVSFFDNRKDFRNIVLINAAGISYNSLAHKADIESWSSVIETNLIGSFNVCRALLPQMRTDEFGRIINFSSVVAQAGVVGTSAYAASKSALWGLSRSIAVENASKNVTINSINLGYFDIGMIEQVPDAVISEILKKIPAKRLGNPAEILLTMNYIIATAYLNGTSIDLNGGLF